MKTPLFVPRTLLGLALGLLVACSKPGSGASDAVEDENAAAVAGDFVQTDSDTTPEQRRHLDYGRSVVVELAARDYAAFFARLSTHARARMSLNQFAPADDETVFEKNEKSPRSNPALPEFLGLMAAMEKQFGRPEKPLQLQVFSTDLDILAGRKKEPADALEILFAIGNMPASVPVEIRRAALRAQVQVELSAEQLAEAAKAHETTSTELVKDPDFQPYLTLKLVLVEEAGEPRVGYFEFLPPSMLD